MLSFWKYLHWKTFYVFGCISETAAKFSYSYLVKSCHSTSILSSSVFGTCTLIKQQAHPILPPKKNAERDIEMGTQLLSCCEIIPPDGRDLKISLHYIMEICQEDNVYIREPWSRLSLFSQRAQLHDIIYLCLESTVAAMKSIQTVLPSHPTERHQVLLGTVLNTAWFLFWLLSPAHDLQP